MEGLISPISSSIKRALIGRLELADLAVRGPGKGPSLVAEQFAFQQRFGQCRAVQTDKRTLLARTGEVHGPRDQFLAHAAFAADQHRGPTGSGPRNFLLDLSHQMAGADDFAFAPSRFRSCTISDCVCERFSAQFLLPLEVPQRQRHVLGHGQREFQIVGIERLGRCRCSRGAPVQRRWFPAGSGAQITLVA